VVEGVLLATMGDVGAGEGDLMGGGDVVVDLGPGSSGESDGGGGGEGVAGKMGGTR
jgi:hypothetical protein